MAMGHEDNAFRGEDDGGMEGLVRMMWMQFACSACYTLSLLKPVTVTAVTACTA